jgi:hypothetical protein
MFIFLSTPAVKIWLSQGIHSTAQVQHSLQKGPSYQLETPLGRLRLLDDQRLLLRADHFDFEQDLLGHHFHHG